MFAHLIKTYLESSHCVVLLLYYTERFWTIDVYPEMLSIIKQMFLEAITGIFFTNLENANRKHSSWLLKESKMGVFSKKGMRNEIEFGCS